MQAYPECKIELIVPEACSSDDTVAIAKAFGAMVVTNRLVTGEAGKALGARIAQGEYILFIDSDNVLTSRDWLVKMLKPLLVDSSIVASEALYYGWDRSEPWIIRYCALMGADDPLSVYLGFYGRFSLLKQRWSDIRLDLEERGSYLVTTLRDDILPTMGANGFLIRADVLRLVNDSSYLFDVDLAHKLVRLGYKRIARVKVSVTHLYAFSFTQYIRKAYRRIRDYYLFRKLGVRLYEWHHFDRLKLAKLLLGVALLFPLFKDAVRGYRRKPDTAWFLNWPLCFFTIVVYGIKEIFLGFDLLRRIW